MPTMATPSMGNTPAKRIIKSDNMKLIAPEKANIKQGASAFFMDIEKNNKGFLSSYLEGQTPLNKISNFLKGTKL